MAKKDHLKVLPSDADIPRTDDSSKTMKVPPPPDWLPNAYAVKEWCRLAPLLVENNVLNENNIGALGQMCALHGRICAAWYTNGTPRDSWLRQHRQFSKDFGLDAKQTAPRPAAPSTGTNAFLKNGRRDLDA
jgi:hypothetical protein